MLNKKIISENFSRAASSYESVALVQKYAARKLCELVAVEIKPHSRALDLGSGTSFIAQHLPENVQIFETDLSFEMLQQNNLATHKIQCDFENLPFKNNSFDILLSSFSLQWLNDFEKTFAHFSQILKPNGILAFALPTFESLNEIRTASVASKCYFNFNDLPKTPKLKLALKKYGFTEKNFATEIFKSEFENGTQALKSIKHTGANYSKKNNLVTKSKLADFNNFCLKNFATDNKNIVISWNVSFFIFQNQN